MYKEGDTCGGGGERWLWGWERKGVLACVHNVCFLNSCGVCVVCERNLINIMYFIGFFFFLSYTSFLYQCHIFLHFLTTHTVFPYHTLGLFPIRRRGNHLLSLFIWTLSFHQLLTDPDHFHPCLPPIPPFICHLILIVFSLPFFWLLLHDSFLQHAPTSIRSASTEDKRGPTTG